MKHRRGRTVLLGVVVAFVATIFAAPAAFAKGPSQGVITGPGLAHPITLREPGATTIGPDLANVVEQSGFFVGMFQGSGTRGRLRHRPTGALGPRYTITYTMTLPNGRFPADIVQYVFPYAEPRPVTHMPPNQKYWGSNVTVGAWYAAHIGLKETLIGLGLPATALSGIPTPAAGGAPGTLLSPRPEGSLAIPLSIAAALAALTLAAILTRRRRTRHSVHT